MRERFSPFDPADALEDAEMIGIFLNEALQSGQVAHVASALQAAARSPGVQDLAQKAGLSSEQVIARLCADLPKSLGAAAARMRAVGIDTEDPEATRSA